MAERDLEAARRLGRAIRVRREQLDLKRRQLHEAAGISYPYLSEIENGTKEPSPQRLRAIAVALQTTPEELLAQGAELASVADQQPRVAASSGPEARFTPSLAEALPSAQQSIARADALRTRPPSEVADAVARELARWSAAELPGLVRQEVDRYLRELAARETGSGGLDRAG